MSRQILITYGDTTYQAEVATIKRTHVGYEDHNIPSFDIEFAGPSWGQCLGARGIERNDGVILKGLALTFMFDVIDTVGVRSWEQLPGRQVLVLRDSTGRSGMITGIANLVEENKILILDTLIDDWMDRWEGAQSER